MKKKYIKPSSRVIPLGLLGDVMYTTEGTMYTSGGTGAVQQWGVKGEKTGTSTGEGTYKVSSNLWDEEW